MYSKKYGTSSWARSITNTKAGSIIIQPLPAVAKSECQCKAKLRA